MIFAPFAQSVGAPGLHVDKADEVEDVVQSAIDHPSPALVDITVNQIDKLRS